MLQRNMVEVEIKNEDVQVAYRNGLISWVNWPLLKLWLGQRNL